MSDNRVPVTQTAAWRIQQLITRQELKPGDKLPSQRDLAQHLGISRNSLREALATLEIMGVIDVQAGRGAYIGHSGFRTELEGGEPSGQRSARFTLAEIYQMRFALEGLTVRLAARRAGEADIRELRRINRSLELCFENRQLAEAAQLDNEFHTAIADLSGNSIVRDVLCRYQALVLESQQLPLYALDRLAEPITEHAALVDAIEAGDPALAEAAIHFHLLQAGYRTGTRFTVS